MDNHIKTNQDSIFHFVSKIWIDSLDPLDLYKMVPGQPRVVDWGAPKSLGRVFEAFQAKYPLESFIFGFRTGAWAEYEDRTFVIGRRDEPTPAACPRPTTATQTPTTIPQIPTTASQAPTAASQTTPVQTCGPPMGCELGSCSGIFTAGVGRCQGAHKGCQCNPSSLTPGFCSQQLSCGSCAGAYGPNSDTAHCQEGPFQGCACVPIPATCGAPQNCDANGCGGTFDDSSNIARCRVNFKGCQCNPVPSSCGSPQSCDNNGCAGTFDDNSSKAYCRANFPGCECIPSQITCGAPQSCDNNGCAGTFDDNSSKAFCRSNFPGCECIPSRARLRSL